MSTKTSIASTYDTQRYIATAFVDLRSITDHHKVEVLSQNRAIGVVRTSGGTSILDDRRRIIRRILLDYLVQVHEHLELLPETLHLAINTLDRYCSCRDVRTDEYQLLACVTLLTAAKYGDSRLHVPSLEKLGHICCKVYKENDFIDMEVRVLQAIGWNLGHLTVIGMQPLAIAEICAGQGFTHMSWYLADIALYGNSFPCHRPSVVATCTLVLAQSVILWCRSTKPCRRLYTGLFDTPCIDPKWLLYYDERVARILRQGLDNTPHELHKKYSCEKFSSVAIMVDDFVKHQKARALELAPQIRATTVSDARMNSSDLANRGSNSVSKDTQALRAYIAHERLGLTGLSHTESKILVNKQDRLSLKRKRAEEQVWFTTAVSGNDGTILSLLEP